MSRQISDLDPIDSVELEISDLIAIEDVDVPRTKKITLAQLAHKLDDIQTPIGSLYFNGDDDRNPSDPALKGFGTWELYAQGRVPAGVSLTDTDFATAGQTGGAKRVTLTQNEMPVHNHGINDPGHSHTEQSGNRQEKPIHGSGDLMHGFVDGPTNRQTASSGTGISIQNSGGGASHQNMQPYIAVYIWKRTG